MLKKKKPEVEEDDFRTRAKRSKKDKEEKGRFKFAPNTETTFRILKTPAAKERNSPSVFMYYRVHRHVGPNDGWGRCGKNMDGGGECWLEDVQIPKLRKLGKTAKAAKLESEGVFVLQLAVLDPQTEEWRGPLKYETSEGKSANAMSYRMETLIQSTKRDFVSHKNGYNVTVERTGSGKNDTRYGPAVPDEEPSDVPIQIVKRLKPFEDILPQYDEEQLKAAYFGRDKEEDADQEDRPVKAKKRARDEDEEVIDADEEQDEEQETESEDEEEVESEEEEPAPKKKGKPVVKKKKVEDEEDESEEEEETTDDESEEESEEEEEPAPKAKAKKKPKPAADEDEDESEEEETESDDEAEEEEETDEDEEPAPKKKTVAKKKSKVVDEEEEEVIDEDETPADEDESEEEEEEEEPAPKKVKKPLKKKH